MESNKQVTAEELHEVTEALQKLTDDSPESKEISDSLITLLAMPTEQFEILAPGVLQSFQQTLNNPNDKLGLTQAFNALGYTAEDMGHAFDEIGNAIDKLEYPNIKKDFLKQIFGAITNSVNSTEGIAKRTIQIPIELCHPNAKIPQYAHISDSGLDIYALDDITIHPGETALVPTGFKIALPPGFEFQVRPKSGRALKTKLRVANTPGTIDQGYRDEVKVIIENVEPPIRDITIDEDGRVTSILYGSDFSIGKGEKFAQLVLSEVPKAAFYRVDNVSDIGEDRGGGFGSSGLK
jgi:dUTP pyrophosphatase